MAGFPKNSRCLAKGVRRGLRVSALYSPGMTPATGTWSGLEGTRTEETRGEAAAERELTVPWKCGDR